MHWQRLDGDLPLVVPGLITNDVQIDGIMVLGRFLPPQVELILWMAGEIHNLRSTGRDNVCPLDDSVRVVTIILPCVRLYVDLVLSVGSCKGIELLGILRRKPDNEGLTEIRKIIKDLCPRCCVDLEAGLEERLILVHVVDPVALDRSVRVFRCNPGQSDRRSIDTDHGQIQRFTRD